MYIFKNYFYMVSVREKELKESVDFYWTVKDGIRFRVFTEEYLLKRGYCCNNNCKHCPYKK